MTSAASAIRVVHLATPPLPLLVPEGIFDAFAWCASDRLEWRCGARWDGTSRIDGADPARMVFVVRPGAADFLPTELAALHAFGLGLTGERALSPWAIDDATDGLYAHRARPGDALWLAADNLNALFWGLHDWAHFHNHGSFEPHQRSWTELQCDASALAWLWINRACVPLTDEAWLRLRGDVLALTRKRFEDEGAVSPEAEARLGAVALQTWPDCEPTTRS